MASSLKTPFALTWNLLLGPSVWTGDLIPNEVDRITSNVIRLNQDNISTLFPDTEQDSQIAELFDIMGDGDFKALAPSWASCLYVIQ